MQRHGQVHKLASFAAMASRVKLICLELISEERIIALVMIHTSILHTVALELDSDLAPLSFERR